MYYLFQVMQRRMDGSEDFNRTWQEFAEGFGNLTGEFWAGMAFNKNSLKKIILCMAQLRCMV